MNDSKIFSKIHEAYKKSFEIFEIFGVFEVKNPNWKIKMWTVFITILMSYPSLAFILGYKSIENFGKFVEHTAIFVIVFNLLVQLINLKVWQNKIIEIATSFQELKKFDENDIVKNSEFFMNRIIKIGLVWVILMGSFYCLHQNFFNGKLVFCDWIEYFADSHLSILLGIADWIVVALLGIFFIHSQKVLLMAYFQLTAHLKCLIVKFSKIEKPKSAEDSNENLEKLREIIGIHQSLKQ
jgi:hypothetical protein